jgi:ElaB/YqjD/DUF883 family membrane-anchored ribosome-binding protein
MTTIDNTANHLARQGQDMADTASRALHDGVRATQNSADQALDKLSEKASELKSEAAPMLGKVSERAHAYIDQGRDAARDAAQQLRDQATRASNMALDYTRDEPVRALLAAAATGALLMGLVAILARSRD